MREALATECATPDSLVAITHNWHRVLPNREREYCDKHFIDDIVSGRFLFNGEHYELGAPINWLVNPSSDLEWHILLHKFYYAPGLVDRFLETNDVCFLHYLDELIASWILQVEPGFIACDVTARRVQNWLYALSILSNAGGQVSLPYSQNLLVDSLVEQVEYIIANMAPSRNHRTMEIYTVFLAAIAMADCESSDKWLALSTELMLENIEQDLLDDGVHCELSTDYHHIVLRSYLLFYQHAKLHDLALPAWLDKRLCQALDFSMHIHRPDGHIPALSDGDSRDFTEILALGAELFGREDYRFVASGGMAGQAPVASNAFFASSGYYIQRSNWLEDPYRDARYLVFDAGPVGAGNHGHMDALNVELYAYGHPLVADPGRYTYREEDAINWRKVFRGNQSHNTVTVDGKDQACYKLNRKGKNCKIGGPFPDTRLIEASQLRAIKFLHGVVTSPNYDAQHEREIWFANDSYWVIVDRLSAINNHEYALNFQLTPDVDRRLSFSQQGAFSHYDSGRFVLSTFANINEVSVERGYVSCTYGLKEEAPRLLIRKQGDNVTFLSFAIPYKTERPVIEDQISPDECLIKVNASGYCDAWRWQGLTTACGSLHLDSSWRQNDV